MSDPEFRGKVNVLASTSADVNMPIIMEKMSWKPFESIMDYGCGDGELTSLFLFPVAEKYSSAITAVDTSSQQIEFAKEKYPHVLADFIVGDIMAEDPFKWSLQNKKFDKIICMDCIHLFENCEEVLQRLSTQLNKGGQLVASIPFLQFQLIRCKLGEHPKWSKYFASPRVKEELDLWTNLLDPLDFPNSMRLMIDKLELKIIDFLSYDETTSYDSGDEFADFMVANISSAKDLPAKLLKELKEEILLQGSQIFAVPTESKPFTITSNYLRFMVEK